MAVDKLVDSTQLDADLTSVADAIRTKGGTSGQMAFPAGFVSAVQAIPTGITPTGTKQISITQNGTTTEDVAAYANAEIAVNVQGGSGFTTIASGTFIGSNNSQSSGRQYILIGNKMAQTDFFVLVKARNGEEFPVDGNYKWVWLYAECRKAFGHFDLSSTGNKSFIPSTDYYIDSNNSGTITAINLGGLIKFGVYYRNSGLNEFIYNTFQLCRDINRTAGFQIHLGHSNPAYPFIPITFEYEVVYFGNDPANDIIDLS